MTVAWVVGCNGLLGSALSSALCCKETILFKHTERFCWGNEPILHDQLESAVEAFATYLQGNSEWHIYWAAGVGSMGSTQSELDVETRALSALIKFIESQTKLITAKGSCVFASSAGAIYAGSTDDIINEHTPIAPTTVYAHEKLKQENLISEFANNNGNVTALLARISTLYGAGSANSKRRGLITEIARRIARNQPMQIYVPFDTLRDYIIAQDAAVIIISTTNLVSGKSGVFMKIIASEQSVTIAEIISTFKRVARRPPRIVTSASKLSGIYSRRIQYRSHFVSIKGPVCSTSLLVGISQVMSAERLSYAASQFAE